MENRTAQLLLKGAVAECSEDEQRKIAEKAAAIRALREGEDDDAWRIAICLVALEVSLED